MSAMHVGGISPEQYNVRQPVPFVLGHPQAKTCRIAIAGFGTVGSAVARLLYARADGQHLRLTHVFNREVARKKVGWTAPDVVWTDRIEQVLASDADVVVELMGGLSPAYELVHRALRARKSVVTANKQLIAHHGCELQRLADDNGQYLGSGACVAGGIPVLSALQDGLAGDRLLQLRGILNGTCNYILTRIEAGACYADALREAQDAGLAEADPSSDVDGQDAAAKLAILARVGLKIAIPPEQVMCRTIRDVSAIDFAYARELGCTIRQISSAKLAGGNAYLGVGPALVPFDLPFAKVTGRQNLVVSTGEFGGETSFGGNGAGGDPTAVAVVSDLLEAARHQWDGVRVDYQPVSDCVLNADLHAPRYLRFVVRDRAGIIACIAGRLAKYDMNINSVLQKPGEPKAALPFVITLESCLQSQLDAALEEINHFDFLVEAPVTMPVLE